jgi:two-component system LytT family response regulator
MPDLKIKTIIADGDESSVQILKQLIQINCPEIEIVSVSSTLKHTVDSIKEFSPGLIFIETELPDGSSFKMLQMWPDRKFRVVFVSTNPDYAVQAFRFSVSDYLIKPVSSEELIAAVEKVRSELAEANSPVGFYAYSGKPNGFDQLSKTLVVTNSKGFKVLKTDEIIFLEADGYCTNFYLLENTKISSSRNLKFYSGQLPTSNFMRVHHSFIVNLNHVKGYGYHEEILLTNNLSCSLSAAHKAEFLSHFKNRR